MSSPSAKSENRVISHAYSQITPSFDDDNVIPSFFEDWDPDATDQDFQTGFPESNEDTMPIFPDFINLPQGRSSPKAPQPTEASQQVFNSHSNNNNNSINRTHSNNLVAKTTSSFPLGRPGTVVTPPTPPPSTPAHTPTPSASNSVSLPQTCQCQQLILSKLSEMSHRKTSHTVPFDQCLSENKSVIVLCNITVNCSNPHHDDDLVLTLTHLALIAHVILFYDRLLESQYEMVDSSSEDGKAIQASSAIGYPAHQQGRKKQQLQRPSSKPQPHPLNRAQSERHRSHDQQQQQQQQQQQSILLRVRLSLGTYELDTRDQQILQNNLLRIELSKIKSLMEAFERRFCTLEWISGGVLGNGSAGMGGEHGEGGMSKHGDGEEKPLGEIIAWLKRRLRGNYEALAHPGGVRM